MLILKLVGLLAAWMVIGVIAIMILGMKISWDLLHLDPDGFDELLECVLSRADDRLRDAGYERADSWILVNMSWNLLIWPVVWRILHSCVQQICNEIRDEYDRGIRVRKEPS